MSVLSPVSYCISVDEKRWDRFRSDIPTDWPFSYPERMGIHYRDLKIPEWWGGKPKHYGNMMSHFQVINRALDEGHDYIALFEDDAVPMGYLSIGWDRVKDLSFDFLWMGGQWMSGRPRPEGIITGLRHKIIRSHALCLSRKAMELIREFLMPDKKVTWALDNHYYQLKNRLPLGMYACTPFLFKLPNQHHSQL